MNKAWLQWFKQQGWKPFLFQKEAWSAYANGGSGLVHAPTGFGKTYAVWGGPLLEWMREHPQRKAWPKKQEPFSVLWITPLRALANDTLETLQKPLVDLGIPWTVELRTGDTTAVMRRKQKEFLPTALITTPESLSVLLSHADTRLKFASLKCVIVDEWHELLGTKRGVQTELCLARLRHWLPGLRTWGLSATLGNLDQALHVLLGDKHQGESRIIAAQVSKRFQLKTLLPKNMERFPWSGHIGLKLLPEVIREIENKRTTLLFTNTRSQTEIWYRALQEIRPAWKDQIALHHGSVDRELRQEVETRLRAGTIKCVVCTASLDLGVDFSPVEQVIQVGGPKGIARMLQRAGRSGHQPGALSRILCVPAHALELVEFAAVRESIGIGDMESREPLEWPLDVLAQHVVTLAMGGGFKLDDLRREVQSTHAYRKLADEDWEWVLDFVSRGGQALRAYPQFQKVVQHAGTWLVDQQHLMRYHRMSIGTITSDASVAVKMRGGGNLGTIEESFIARLRPGDIFSFAGKSLEFIRLRDMVAHVQRASKPARQVPQWMGGKMPLSTQLAKAVRQQLAAAKRGVYRSPEMKAVKPVLDIQAAWSVIPDPDEFLVEWTQVRDVFYYFLYPFAGRLAHEGLAALIAHRLGKSTPRSFTLTMNDYGFALATSQPLDMDEVAWRDVLTPRRLLEDMLDCLNSTELARRKFREIARIAGLVFQGYPGAGKSTRQLQASSGLFYDVFNRYDPGNRLLVQSRREVIEQQLEVTRLRDALGQIQSMPLLLRHTERLTPLSFPLWAMWAQGQVNTEQWGDRIEKMVAQLESAAGKTVATKRGE